MGSKRHQRRKSCDGKIQFKSQRDAERAAGSYSATYKVWMTAYHCQFCKQYHIGHPPKRIRRAIENETASRNAD